MDWNQFGLLGIIIGSAIVGLAWLGKRFLDKGGYLDRIIEVMEQGQVTLGKVTELLDEHEKGSLRHREAAEDSNGQIKQIHSAALSAVDEVQEECRKRDIDVRDACDRVRRALTA